MVDKTRPTKSRHQVPVTFALNGPEKSEAIMILAHGAGMPMDNPFMNAFAGGIAKRGVRVGRFEFPYMAKYRRDGKRRPPDPIETLVARYLFAIKGWGRLKPKVVIGGKSMGGRIATMIADVSTKNGNPVAGVVVLGFPFHPQGKPEDLRIDYLKEIKTPVLIIQGTCDPLGNKETVEKLELSENVEIMWVEGGDHNLRPPQSAEASAETVWPAVMDRIVDFITKLPAAGLVEKAGGQRGTTAKPAKPPAKKAPAKKAAAKKTPVKKAPVKKAPAKKATPKKTTAKKKK